MSAKKKVAAKAPDTTPDEPKAGESSPAEGPEPYVGLKNVYRADLGESLPPQKPAGVE